MMESYQTDCKLGELKNKLLSEDPLYSLKKELQKGTFFHKQKNKTDEVFLCPWDNHQGDITYFR